MTSTFESFREATGKVRPGANHGCKPVEVVPGVWTAHFHDIEDTEALKKVSPGVTTVVNCAPDKCPTKAGSYGDNVDVVVIDLLDDPEEYKKVDAMPEGPEKVEAKSNLPKFPPEQSAGDAKKDFDHVIDIMVKAKESGGASLVHCHASLSRSAAFIIAYLMKTEKLTAIQAVHKMKAQWDAVWPNDTFTRQLVAYEKELKNYKPIKLRKPKWSKVEKVNPDSEGINLMLKCVSCKEVTIEGASSRVWEATVGDETGTAILSLRSEDQAKLCEPGTSLRMQNAKIVMVKGYIRIAVNKWAVLKKADEAVSFEAKTSAKNISEEEFELAG